MALSQCQGQRSKKGRGSLQLSGAGDPGWILSWAKNMPSQAMWGQGRRSDCSVGEGGGVLSSTFLTLTAIWSLCETVSLFLGRTPDRGGHRLPLKWVGRSFIYAEGEGVHM